MKALQTKLDHSLSSETEEQDTAYSLWQGDEDDNQ
jgi:hypothetical protein